MASPSYLKPATSYDIKSSLRNRLQDTLDEIISFPGTHKNLCVCLVDAVNSTRVTAPLTKEKICKYYSIFLNGMATIAKEFGAVVVKNVGDSLLYYFPDTSNSTNVNAFANSLECGLEMINARSIINDQMSEYHLPPVSYRISADYGSILAAKSIQSPTDDIFGPAVNICAKMNHMAVPNSMIIGGDLHQIVKFFDCYEFHSLSGVMSGLKLEYPVYSVMHHNV